MFLEDFDDIQSAFSRSIGGKLDDGHEVALVFLRQKGGGQLAKCQNQYY